MKSVLKALALLALTSYVASDEIISETVEKEGDHWVIKRVIRKTVGGPQRGGEHRGGPRRGGQRPPQRQQPQRQQGGGQPRPQQQQKPAQPSQPAPGGLAGECINAHQKWRGQVGVPQLRWSNEQAASAQKWADHLAATGKFEHSRAGENLAMGGGASFSNTQFVDMWGNEIKDFQFGTFPNVAKNGKQWSDVGHYTQVVWRNTQEVGCGRANGAKGTYFVCHYNPAGNFMGQKPY